MSKLLFVTAIAAAILSSTAMAQTTLGGNAKDNTASGGMENGTTAGSGKGMPMKGNNSMMKSDGMSKMNAPADNQMDKGSSPTANGK